MPNSLCLAVAVLFGVALGANGVFMLVSPESWYFAVPGVTSTGPFNQHFLRDIGLIFLFLGGAFLVGTARPQFRILLWAAPTIWLCGHALFHFWEVAVGICAPSVIPRDFPAVTLPAIIGVALTIWAIRNARSATAASARVHVELLCPGTQHHLRTTGANGPHVVGDCYTAVPHRSID